MRRGVMRPGYLLAEALCALALAGLLAAAAGLALAGARRSMHAAERRDRAERAERETVAILRAALASADGIVIRGDTAVDLDVLVGTGVVCAAESFALLLPPPATSASTPLLVLTQPLSADDVIAVRTSEPDAEETWWIGVVDSAQLRHVPGVCDAAGGWRATADAGAPLMRLSLFDEVPPAVIAGAPARIGRRGRFTLYHAGRGEWMLGWRRCHPWLDACGVVQPVSGPLRPPAAGGLRIRQHDNPFAYEISALGADGGRGARTMVYR